MDDIPIEKVEFTESEGSTWLIDFLTRLATSLHVTMIHFDEGETMPASKIAIFGPPLAGKTTILSAYARSRGLKTTNGPAHFTANTIAPPRLSRTCKAGEHAQAATYSGAVWSIDDWEPLLEACDALLVVLDSQATRMDTNMVDVQFLREARLNVRACFLFSKSDLSSSLPAKEVRKRLALCDDPFRDWPSYESTDQAPDTVLAPFDFLLGD